jgi:capsular exopolysaccharide synthesis family protein
MSDLIKRPQSVPATDLDRETIWVDDYVEQKESELNKYFEILVKRKLVIAGIVLGAIALTAAWTYSQTPRYKSVLRIQIDPEQTVLPYKDIYESVTAGPRYLETQAQVLKSEALIRRVIRRLNLAKDPDNAPGTVGWFASSLLVSPVINTQVVSVSFISTDPKFAATAVNTLADEYIDYTFETRRDATTKAKEFLEGELHTLRQKLEQSEQQLTQYAREHNILLGADADNVVLQKFGDMSREMTKVEAELLSIPYEAVRNSTPDTFPETLKTNAMRDLEQRRAVIQEKLTDVSLRFGPKWPEVVTLKEQLSAVNAQLSKEMRRASDQVRLQYDLANAHRRRVATALEEQNRLVDRQTQDSIQFNILKREVETDRQLHEGLLQRLKEADVSSGLRTGNIHVIDRAHVPTMPYWPNPPRNFAVAIAVSLTAGIMLAFLMEFLDRTVRSPEDVQQSLGVPFLATIPALHKSLRRGSPNLLVQGMSEGRNGALTRYVPSGAEVFWEGYRALRTSLLISSTDQPPRTMLITSAMPGEGKSTTAVNLGIALAQTGARTLILDLDMRQPSLGAMFNVDSNSGVSTYLSGEGELHAEIRDSGIPNLYVIPAGPVRANAPELIGSARMHVALALLAQHFQYVLIDTPPLMSVTDALVVSPHVDGVVLVVRGGKTKKPVIQSARNMLRGVNANILGVLVNDLEVRPSDYGYAQGYYASSEIN